jgi:serine/threonine protein kinase
MVPLDASQRGYSLLRLVRKARAFDLYDGERMATRDKVSAWVWRGDSEAEPACSTRDVVSVTTFRSPHVAVVHDVGEYVPRTLAVVTEYLEGESLRERFSGMGGPMPPADVVPALVQALAGLADAHEHALIHGHLGLDSIFIVRDDDGREVSKLVGFGVCPIQMPSLFDSDYEVGAGEKTPSYQQRHTARLDVRAMAGSLFECITGQPHTEGTGVDVPELCVRYPALDVQLAQILSKAVGGELSRGYQTAREFHFALTQWIQQDKRRTSVRPVGLVSQSQPIRLAPPPPPASSGNLPTLPKFPISVPPLPDPDEEARPWRTAVVAALAFSGTLGLLLIIFWHWISPPAAGTSLPADTAALHGSSTAQETPGSGAALSDSRAITAAASSPEAGPPTTATARPVPRSPTPPTETAFPRLPGGPAGLPAPNRASGRQSPAAAGAAAGSPSSPAPASAGDHVENVQGRPVRTEL